MPDYNMSQLVVGGIDKHRFLITTGNDMITNNSFEADDAGWTSVSGALSRYASPDTPFGDYCGKIEDNSAVAEEYAQWEYAYSSSIGGKKFAVIFWAKADSYCAANVQVYSDSTPPYEELDNQDIGVTPFWRPYFVVVSANASADGANLYFRFKPYAAADGVSGTGIIYIDKVSAYEISFDFQLKQAKSFDQSWQELEDVDYDLLDGNNKKYMEGHRYKGELAWDYLEPPEELVRAKLYANSLFIFVPHMDYDWALLCRTDGEYKRAYFKDKYIGHEGNIVIKGAYKLEVDPPEIPAGAGQGDVLGSGTLTYQDVIVI